MSEHDYNDIRRYVFESIIKDFGRVVVYVRPNEDCRLPDYLKNQGVVVLDIWLDAPVPITDLIVDRDGWSATLSFGRIPSYCQVPWGAVECVRTAEDVGAKGVVLIVGGAARTEVEAAEPEEKKPALRVVPDPETEESA